jgi:hypothetical protein
MTHDKVQASRFELKYLVTEDLAQRMRPFVQSYIDIDEDSACLPDFSYPTLSFTRGESWVYRRCPRKTPEVLVEEFLSAKDFPATGVRH